MEEVNMRDVFAMMAMQGICAGHQWNYPLQSADVAKAAYKVADAMMVQRELSEPEAA